MKRAVYGSAVTVALVAFMAASTYSQTQRSQVRATRRTPPSSTTQSATGQSLGGQASGGQSMQSSTGPMDPNMTPQQQMAQQQREFQQRVAEMQQQAEEMQRQAEARRDITIREVLNATDDQQWERIKPKLYEIDRLKAEVGVSANPGPSFGGGGVHGSWRGRANTGAGGFIGGSGVDGSGKRVMSASGRPQTWTFGSRYPGRNIGETTDGRVLCEQLVSDLQTPATAAKDIAQRIAELRRIRTQAQENLARARKDLRTLITASQEPGLILMGYLD